MKSVCAVLLAMTAVFTAKADLVSSTGQVSVIAPPGDVRVNLGIESDTLAFFFTERTGLLLPSGIGVNITTPGTYASSASLTPGTIGAGTVVNSYYLHADPVGATAPLRIYDGSVTFDTPILGVIVEDAQFAASNGILGHPGTLYSSSGQGLELGAPDTVTLAVVGKTLSFHLGTNTAADDIRIVTAAVPEPGSWVLLGSAALLIAAGARRRATRR